MKVPQRSGGEVPVLRIRVAAAESKMKAAKAESREARRRRKEAKRAAQNARKLYKQAKTELAELREALAGAEAKLLPPESRAQARKAGPSKPSARTRRGALKTPGSDRSRSQPAQPARGRHPASPGVGAEASNSKRARRSVREPKRRERRASSRPVPQGIVSLPVEAPVSTQQKGFESATPLSSASESNAADGSATTTEGSS